jgi:hypothetical protein
VSTRYLLAALGRAEPGEVQGWMETGGILALQRALAMDPAALRAALDGIARRDGRGLLSLQAGQPAHLNLTIGPAPDPTRLIVEELPVWLLGAALLLALACEQRVVTIHLTKAGRDHRALLDESRAAMQQLGIVGAGGWAGGIRIEWSPDFLDNGLDAVTALLLPVILWQHRDPGTTLLAASGAVGSPGVYEIPFGLPLRTFLYTWAGGVPPNVTLHLGERRLELSDLSKPLAFEHFGPALGSGRLTVSVG